jgi:hypothetical protein
MCIHRSLDEIYYLRSIPIICRLLFCLFHTCNPVIADGDIRGLVQVFQTLPASAREQWMAIGRTLQNMPAVANTDAAVEQLMSGAI